MNYAKLANSPRLQRVHDFLSDGAEHSTRDIMYGAQVCAVSACVHELRENGAEIECRQFRESPLGDRIWLYRMTRPVPDKASRVEA